MSEGPQPQPRYFPGGERFAFFLLLVAVLVLAVYTLKPVLPGPVLAAAVASLSYPAYERLARRFGERRGLASATMVALLVLGVLGPVATVIVIGSQRLVSEIGAAGPGIAEVPLLLDRLAARLGSPLADPLRKLADTIAGGLGSILPAVAHRATAVAGAFGNFLVQFGVGFLLFCLSLYYFYIEGIGWRERFVHLLPIGSDKTRAFLGHFRGVSVAVFAGSLGTAAVQGIIAGVGYWLIGVDAPLVWAIFTAAASFIPGIGTTIVWIPLSIQLGVTRSWIRGGLLFGYGMVVIGLADNVVRPILTRWGLNLHPLLVFLSVFGGVATFGLEGIFVGPLIIATAVAALAMYEIEPAE